ncbi:septum site-determining protein MinC [Chryseomicrobium palamuruense]|uniref:Probable septum site-determining protein MinC n=1 Tax=Chryseomicrobium palamuruense TaxID=682973 RepID=A0ABV8V028_9BACL
MSKQQGITIRGTKDGLVMKLDEQMGYSELLQEIEQKLTEEGFDGQAEMTIQLGHRFLTNVQKKELIQLIEQGQKIRITKVQSEVMTVEEYNKRLIEKQSETYVGIVRSGQVVKAQGDLVVIGDVNPNGRVVAGGNIYVLGRLKGIAHAGANGNRTAVIAASWLEATHLKIDDVLETMTDELTVLSEHPEMECAYLHTTGKLVIDRLQELRRIRPDISTFKGGS